MDTGEHELVAKLPSYQIHLASSSVRKKHLSSMNLESPSVKHGG
jgi:hypothetical protein